MSSTDRAQLRQQLRAMRNDFVGEPRKAACQTICDKLTATETFQKSQKIALYWPNDGEPETSAIQEAIWSADKAAYLPVLKDKGSRMLSFLYFDKGTRLTENLYGIPEPSDTEEAALESLDLILMPLVGFDEKGNRLGMGGGFYDVTLASIHQQNRRAQLIGIAFECQKLTLGQITSEDWDVPMDAVVTERELYRFS